MNEETRPPARSPGDSLLGTTEDVEAILERAYEFHDVTPSQRAELDRDKRRAAGWFAWEQTNRRGIAAVLAKFRTGRNAPVGYYQEPMLKVEMSEEEKLKMRSPKKAPDYPATLRLSEALVRNAGHELLEEHLLEEFKAIGEHNYKGNGAMLTIEDRERLLALAASMRDEP